MRSQIYDSLDYASTESIVKADLDYICECVDPCSLVNRPLTHSNRVWNTPSWDLWEEVKGLHHFNMLVSLRALLDGCEFAARLGDSVSAKRYKKVSKEIEEGLERFWDDEKGYLLATIKPENKTKKISWLDTGKP